MSGQKIYLYFAGGVNEIGANKIVIGSPNNSAILLDFGTDYTIDSMYLDAYMPIKKHLEIYSLILLGTLPRPVYPLQGIYRKDLLKQSAELIEKEFQCFLSTQTHITDLLLSHTHGDHYAAIRYITPEIQIHTHIDSKPIIEYLEDSGTSSSFSEIIEYKEEFVEDIKKDKKGNEIKEESGEAKITRPRNRPSIQRPLIYHQDHEKFTDAKRNFEIQIFPVDHSIVGASAFLIKELTTNLKIAYSGDYRLHGRRVEATKRFIQAAKEFEPDILISEGTQVSYEQPGSEIDNELKLEEELIALFQKQMNSGLNSLVVIDTSNKNIDRIQTIFNAVQKTGKKLVLDAKSYEILKRFSSVPNYSFDFSRIFVYFQSKGFGKYSKTDYARDKLILDLMEQSPEKLLKAEEIRKNQREYVMIFGFYKFIEFVELRPNPGSIFIRSSADPFNIDMEINEKKAVNWLRMYKFQEFQTPENPNNKSPILKLHCSGHMREKDIISTINAIKPKILFPIHTEAPQKFKSLGLNPEIKIIIPEKDKLYEF